MIQEVELISENEHAQVLVDHDDNSDCHTSVDDQVCSSDEETLINSEVESTNGSETIVEEDLDEDSDASEEEPRYNLRSTGKKAPVKLVDYFTACMHTYLIGINN